LCKNLWSPSYVFVQAGMCGGTLLAVFALCDVWKVARVSALLRPFQYMGMNALFVFVMGASSVFENLTGGIFAWALDFSCLRALLRGSVGSGGGKAQPTDLRGGHRSHPQIAQRLNSHRMSLSPPERAFALHAHRATQAVERRERVERCPREGGRVPCLGRGRQCGLGTLRTRLR